MDAKREFNEDATGCLPLVCNIKFFFIIVFAPIFSKVWQSKYNPTGPIKFGIGLILLATGFAILSYGSINIPLSSTASQSMIFDFGLFISYTGELCVSPVGLSYVSSF